MMLVRFPARGPGDRRHLCADLDRPQPAVRRGARPEPRLRRVPDAGRLRRLLGLHARRRAARCSPCSSARRWRSRLSWLLFRYVLHPLLGADARCRQARDRFHPLHLRPAVRAAGRGAGGLDRHGPRLQLSRRAGERVRRGDRAPTACSCWLPRCCSRARCSPSCATPPSAAPCARSPPARTPPRWSASTLPATAPAPSPLGGALAAIAGMLLVVLHRHQPDHRRRLYHEGADRRGDGRHRPRARRACRRLDAWAWPRPWRRCCSTPASITVINFAIFSLVLLWRPQGLFGAQQRDQQRQPRQVSPSTPSASPPCWRCWSRRALPMPTGSPCWSTS